MLDSEQIIEDLVRLRNSLDLSLRAIATRSGISREIVRKIESREHVPTVPEVFGWLHACGVSPALWLVQYLNEEELRVRDQDRDLAKTFKESLRHPERRKTIEAFFGMWSAADKKPDKPRRSPPSRRAVQKDGHT